MSDAEKRYPQIDKEARAVTWACERFSDLLIGMTFKIEMDHKPVISLLGNKDLDILPPRVQRFRIRVMRFNYNIVYVPGKEHSSADALSRAPVGKEEHKLHATTEVFVDHVIKDLPASNQQLEKITSHQRED